eukprot:gene123-72_t
MSEATQPLLAGDGVQHVAATSSTPVTIGVLQEMNAQENRVTIPPLIAADFIKKGYVVCVEKGAGKRAGYDDQQYKDAKCTIATRAEVMRKSDIMFSIDAPTNDFKNMSGKAIVSFFGRRQEAAKDTIAMAKKANVTLMDVTAVPRITIAQKFDILSSQASVAGYRAVVEATYAFQRFHEAAMTAAGKYPPSKTMVLGCGVAGLAAIGAAKAGGSLVRAWDVRGVCEEQVESMGASWITVDFKEDGAGIGGYAKESSDAFQAAQRATFAKNAKECDIIITTAAIPGRASPVLITDEMVKMMKPGSVIVDLASAGGGNCTMTKKGQKYKTTNEVTIIGYDNFPSLMSTQASLMYGRNLYNLVDHIAGKQGPSNLFPAIDKALAEGEKGDLTVRNLVCTRASQEYAFPKQPEPTPPKPKAAPVTRETSAGGSRVDHHPLQTALITAAILTCIAVCLTLIGVEVPGEIFVAFILAGVAGYLVVWGVAPALHTPLISVTNAISGLTAVGGLMLLKATHTNLQVKIVSGIAITISAVNVFGGFIVTNRMLLFFQRAGSRDHSYLLFLPGVALIILTLISTTFAEASSIVAALLCVVAIGGLSQQKTANHGVALGINGVIVAIIAAVRILPSTSVMYALAYLAGGAIIGLVIGLAVDPMSLPQTVAALNSLVGIAAVLTAVREFEQDNRSAGLNRENVFIILGVFIGGVTFTGSIVAFGKLHGVLGSKALDLPGKNFLNLIMLAGYGTLMGFFLTTDHKRFALYLLWGTFGLAGLMCYHLVASVGGGDMPVCITVLNSYAGWALVMEGFMLNNPLLTVVGSLIGFSGAILTKIMCDAMNRDIANVIFGGMNTVAKKAEGDGEVKEHTETSPMEVAQMLSHSKNVLIVPGYGMAAGRAQAEVASIANALRDHNITVKFGIHPVAGRMPGQMNVLLAEAGVPYDWVFEMEEINPDIEKFDVCMVVGANDITNSAAVDDPDCAIAGMPVIEVWRCKKVVFCKRSMGGGYADLENPVFFKDNTDMLLGNAKTTCDEVATKFKEIMDAV